MADIPLDFGTLDKYGCFIGSGAVVVFSDKDDIKKVAINLLKFFTTKAKNNVPYVGLERESCEAYGKKHLE